MAGNHSSENNIITKQQIRNKHSFAASDSASIVNMTDLNKSYSCSTAASETNGTKVIRKMILLDPEKLKHFGLDMRVKKAVAQNIGKSPNTVNRTIKLVQKVKLTSALSPKLPEKIPETSINLNLLQQQISNKLNLNKSISIPRTNQSVQLPLPIKTSPTTNNPNSAKTLSGNIKIMKIIPKDDNTGMRQVIQDVVNNFKGFPDDRTDSETHIGNTSTKSGSPICKYTAKRLSDVIKSKSSGSPKQDSADKKHGVVEIIKNTSVNRAEFKIQEPTGHRLVAKQIEVTKIVKSPGRIKNVFTIQGAIVDHTRSPPLTYDINSIPTCSRESIEPKLSKQISVPAEVRSPEQFKQTPKFRTPENLVNSLEFTKSKSGGRKPKILWSKFNKFKKRNKKLEMENQELKSRLYSLMENMRNTNPPNQCHLPFEEKPIANHVQLGKTLPMSPSPNCIPQVKQTPIPFVEHGSNTISENVPACCKTVAPTEEVKMNVPSLVITPKPEIDTSRLRGKNDKSKRIGNSHQITKYFSPKPVQEESKKIVVLDVDKNKGLGCQSVIIERIESPQLVVPVINFNGSVILVPEIGVELEISNLEHNDLEQNNGIDQFFKSMDSSLADDICAHDDENSEMNISIDSSREHDYSLRNEMCEINVREEVVEILSGVQEVESIVSTNDSFTLGDPNVKTHLEGNVISKNRGGCQNMRTSECLTNHDETLVSTKLQEPIISKASTSEKTKSSENQILSESLQQETPEVPEGTFIESSYCPIVPVEMAIIGKQIPKNEIETIPTKTLIQIPQVPSTAIKHELSNKEDLENVATELISSESCSETIIQAEQFGTISNSSISSIAGVLDPVSPVRTNSINKVSIKTEVISATLDDTLIRRSRRPHKPKRYESSAVGKILPPLSTKEPSRSQEILEESTQEVPLIVDTENFEDVFIEPPAYSPIAPFEMPTNSLKEISECNDKETVGNTVQEAMLKEILQHDDDLRNDVLVEPSTKFDKVLNEEVPESGLLSSKEVQIETPFVEATGKLYTQNQSRESSIDVNDLMAEPVKPSRKDSNRENLSASNLDTKEFYENEIIHKSIIEIKSDSSLGTNRENLSASNLDTKEFYENEIIHKSIIEIKSDSSLGTPDTSVARTKRQRKQKTLLAPVGTETISITPSTKNRRRSRRSVSPITNCDKTPSFPIETGKRGARPKKRIKLDVENVLSDDDEFLGFPDNVAIPLPINVSEIKTEPDSDPKTVALVKKTPSSKQQKTIICGNCKESLLATNWNAHLRKHNGLGFRDGLDEPIDFTDYRTSLNVMIFYMKMHKITHVTCEKCGTSRKSALGLMSHMKICGLSEEEQRVTCVHCGHRLLPTSLRLHMEQTCMVLRQNQLIELMQKKESEQNPEEEDADEDSSTNLTQSGRAKRKSVKAAEKKIKNFIEQIDDVNLDDHFSEKKPFKITGGTKRGWTSQLRNTGIIKCRIKTCTYTADSIQQMSFHSSTCQNTNDTFGFYCKHCTFYSLLRQPIVEHISNEHGNLLRSINNLENHSGSEASAGEESSESDGSSGVDEIECNGGSDYEDNDDDMIDEDGNDRSRIRSSAGGSSGGGSEYKNTESADALLRDYSLLIKQPQITSSFYHFALRWTNDFIEKHFSPDPLYINFRPRITDYLNITDAIGYYPIPKTSPKFLFQMENVYEADIGRLAKKVAADQWDQLQLFKGQCSQKHNMILYCGGPILCLDWATFPVSYTDDQYLAVSCYQDYNDSTKANELQPKKGLIQLWNLGDLAKKHEPIMKYAFKVDFGAVCDIKFCPSGGYIPAERIGLLAVTSLIGDVYIYSLPYNIDEQKPTNIIELQPSLTLRPCINDTTKCRQAYRLTWTKGKEHSIIAAGYTDGWVAVWNLKTESKLLKRLIQGRPVILPTKIFHPFTGTIRGIEIFYANDSQWLMVAADKNVKMFDLKSYPYPQEVSNVYQKSTVTCGAWSIHWPGYLLGLNESFCLLRNSVTLTQPHEIGYKNYPMQSYDATVTDIAVSDYLNAYVAATDSGDIISFLPRDLLLNISRKGNRRIKLILGFTDVIDFETEQTSDIPSKFGVVFCDLAEPVLSSLNDLKTKRHRRWTLEKYPIVTITRIKFNTNRHFHKYYALGMQAGFVRIRYMVPRSNCYN